MPGTRVGSEVKENVLEMACITLLGLTNKMPPTGWLAQEKCIV